MARTPEPWCRPLYDVPMTQRARDVMTAERAFWLRVAEVPSGCWEWQGDRQRGYGRLRPHASRQTVRAHRYAWEIAFGPIPTGLVVMHTCDNRACVNLQHLRIGTFAENNADRAAKGRSASGDAHPARRHPETRPRGEAHGMAKITETQVRHVRRLLAQGIPFRAIETATGVPKDSVSKIKRGVQWKHVM